MELANMQAKILEAFGYLGFTEDQAKEQLSEFSKLYMLKVLERLLRIKGTELIGKTFNSYDEAYEFINQNFTKEEVEKYSGDVYLEFSNEYFNALTANLDTDKKAAFSRKIEEALG